ncbi:hypothetical protein [Streptomyces nondiastaticus]
MQALYQLSYSPLFRCFAFRPVSLATQTILHDGSSAIDAAFRTAFPLVVPVSELTVNFLCALGVLTAAP